jgi:tRNA A-37 threonylcarbamoyl transferase component Bud32
MPPLDFAKPKQKEEDYESAVERLITNLPNDLQVSWRNKYYDSEHPEQLVGELNDFLNRRKKSFIGDIEFAPRLSESIKQEILVIVENIQETFGDTNYFLGNGATAEVYVLPKAPHLCTKYISNQERYNENNHLRMEFEILTSISSLVIENVRSPKPAFLRIHPSEGHSYGMEKVEGQNLSILLEKPREHEELIAIAKKLDKEKIVTSILAYVRAMHHQKITHNDLFKRNIMLDKEGNLFIIDFGKAKLIEIGKDLEDEQRRDLATVENEVRLFFRDIDNISN